MKIAPPSTDLMIKLGLGLLVVAVAIYSVRKITGAVGGVFTGVADAVGGAVKGAESVTLETFNIIADPHKYDENTQADQDLTGKKYKGPLVNNDGMDFSQF